MSYPLVIVGAGGFGREAIDVVMAQNAASNNPVYDLIGVVDSAPSQENLARLDRRGVNYLGSEQNWLESCRQTHYLVGVGSPKARKLIAERLDAGGNQAAVAVHPTATIGSLVQIGRGSVVCAGVQISTNVSVGLHVHLNPNVTVGHDTSLGDFVSLNPASTVSGDVRCEREVLVGAGATVLQGLTIGSRSVIGAAACVTRDVAPSRIVKGVPAR